MTKARRILLLVENTPAPLDVRVWGEATTLRDAGLQVSIICPKGSTEYQESYICCYFATSCLPFNPFLHANAHQAYTSIYYHLVWNTEEDYYLPFSYFSDRSGGDQLL